MVGEPLYPMALPQLSFAWRGIEAAGSERGPSPFLPDASAQAGGTYYLPSVLLRPR